MGGNHRGPGEMYGILTTLQVGPGARLTPVASPWRLFLATRQGAAIPTNFSRRPLLHTLQAHDTNLRLTGHFHPLAAAARPVGAMCRSRPLQKLHRRTYLV